MLHAYLRHVHPDAKEAAELAYNFHHALTRYSWDADCDMFAKVVRGELCELVHYDQMAMIDKFSKLMVELEKGPTGKKAGKLFSGKVPKPAFALTLRALFPTKTNKETQLLLRLLDSEQAGAIVCYTKLVSEDINGDQGPFIEKMRSSHIWEIEDFMVLLQDEVSKCERDDNDRVSVFDILKAWQAIDPNQSAVFIENCLKVAFDCPTNMDLDYLRYVDVKPFFQQLFRKTLVKRHLNWSEVAKPVFPPSKRKNGRRSSIRGSISLNAM